jgi:hypothetical protein
MTSKTLKSNKIKQFFYKAIGFLILIPILWALGKWIESSFKSFTTSFTTLDITLRIAIIAGFITLIVAVIRPTLDRFLEAKAEKESALRDKKFILYDEFLKKIFEILSDDKEEIKKLEDLVPFLKEIQRKFILCSSPDVIKSYTEWQVESVSQGEKSKVKSIIKMIDFFLALRKDLGHSNKGIKREYLARLMIKSPSLLMDMYKKNPEITLDEIAEVEKESENY